MSKVKEFVDSWNEFLPENRISFEECKNVQESTFRCWLLTILNKLNVETANFENMNQENGTRLRASRMRLLSTVNHFLCINNSMKLNYMNLVSPEYKIVTKSLMYLLNYVFFVNQFYMATIAECAEKVQERNQLQTHKNYLRKEIETNKIKEENSAKLLRDLNKIIPKQNSTIATLKEKEDRLSQEEKRLEEDIENSDMKLVESRAQITSINENIVADEEAESILMSREQALEELSEHEEIMKTNRSKLQEDSTAIEMAQTQVTKMESTITHYTIDFSYMKDMTKQLEDLEANLAEVNDNITRLKSENETLSQFIQQKRENIDELKEQKEKFEQGIGKDDMSNVYVLKELTRELRELCIQEDKLIDQKNRVKEEFSLIYKIATNILKTMSEDIYESE